MINVLKSLRNMSVKMLEILVVVLVVGLTLTVLWGVLTRYLSKMMPFIGGQAEYTDELARLLLIWVSTFGAALAFDRKAHLGVDYFVGKMHPEAARIMAVVVQLIIIALVVVVFLIGGGALAREQMPQILPTISFMTRGMVYMALPLSGLFIVLFTIENLVEVLQQPSDSLNTEAESEG
ncbi:MAG: TRAP transporter small permease subunit [Kiritimatiellae bacterium]|nr:TRAP transporter small permease subunit [Kiritimatiellia bacterium]